MGIRLPLAILISFCAHAWLFQINILSNLPAISLRSFPFSMELSLVTSKPSQPTRVQPLGPQTRKIQIPRLTAIPEPVPEKTQPPILKKQVETPSVSTPGSVTSPREQGTPQAKPLPGQPPPAYPLVAQYRHLEGTVRLEVEVMSEGTCGAIRVKKSSGSQLLDDAAVSGVKRWRFEPARRLGKAVSTVIEVPVVFTLTPSDNEKSKSW